MTLRALALAAACAAALLVPSPLAAAPAAKEKPATAEEVTALRRQLEQLSAELVRLQGELAQHRAQTPPGDGAKLAELEARLAALQVTLNELAERVRVSEQTLESASRAEEKRLGASVYGDLQAIAYRGEPSTFDGHAFELVLSGHPHERLSVFSEIEFEQAAAVGGPRKGEVVVEQAYAAFALDRSVSLRAGVLLVPFGNVNVDHFAPRREVVTRPLVSFVVAPSDWTDNGVWLEGRHLLGTTWVLGYELCAVAGLSAQITGAGMRDARQAYGADNNGDKALVGRLSLNRASRGELGLSGYEGKYDDAGHRRLVGWAADGLVRLGPLKVTGEYNSFVADAAPAPDTTLRGFYVRGVLGLGHRLLPRLLTRGFEEPQLALVGQYDEVRLAGPVDGVRERNRERRITAGLNYRPADPWVLKLTWESNRTWGRSLDRGDRDGFLAAVDFVF